MAVVRAGAAQASVAAGFSPPPGHPALALLAEHGIDTEDGIVLRRVVGADGRSRAFVNDEPVGVALLRRLGALLVEVQGQFAQVGLADEATHAGLLDAFGRLEGERARTAGDGSTIVVRGSRSTARCSGGADSAGTGATSRL